MIRSYQNINRRKSRAINIGNIKIGNGAPISVQTMTNTPTADIKSTLSQIKRIEKVGADIVRVSVPDKESSEALITICKKSNLPIIAEFTFILGPLGPSGVIPIEIPDLSDLTIFLIASEPPFEDEPVIVSILKYFTVLESN